MPEAGKRIRVAVDAMGGDYAPEEIVKGAVLAARKGDVDIILVGLPDVVERELAKCDSSDNLPIRCVHASDVIEEGEPPATAIRRKRNCSIAVAAKLMKAGEADALVGAGSSGAVAVSAIQYVGMLEGIGRPAIGAPLTSFAPDVVLMDIGANTDCKPHHLLSFAIAGSVYARKLFNVANPTVALLSTGTEEGKGNEAVRESYSVLKNSGLNFIGNIEGSDILGGRANVVVCDGFVGNVIIKFYESLGNYARDYIVKKQRKNPLLGKLVKLGFNRLFPITQLSYEGEEVGGGILWGIDGVVRIAHGACRAPHIAHAIASARNTVEADVVGCLRMELAKFTREGKL